MKKPVASTLLTALVARVVPARTLATPPREVTLPAVLTYDVFREPQCVDDAFRYWCEGIPLDWVCHVLWNLDEPVGLSRPISPEDHRRGGYTERYRSLAHVLDAKDGVVPPMDELYGAACADSEEHAYYAELERGYASDRI